MKKIIFFLFLLTSCSLNSNSAYWNENTNLKYEELKYEKDYTFDEYGKILEQYDKRNKIPELNFDNLYSSLLMFKNSANIFFEMILRVIKELIRWQDC